jgi:hypothetical protein
LGYSTNFAYWNQKIGETLRKWEGKSITINVIAEETYIKQKDIHNVKSDLHLLRYDDGYYTIIADKKILEELEKRTNKKGYPLHPEKLIWTPYKPKYDFWLMKYVVLLTYMQYYFLDLYNFPFFIIFR